MYCLHEGMPEKKPQFKLCLPERLGRLYKRIKKYFFLLFQLKYSVGGSFVVMLVCEVIM